MTTTPTSNPTWATDSTVASGPEATLPTKVVPSDGVRQQGFVSGQGVPARTVNSHLNTLGVWIQYLREAIGTRLNNTERIIRLDVASVGELLHAQWEGLIGSRLPWYVGSPGTELGVDNILQTVLLQQATACTFAYQLSGTVPPDSLITKIRVTVKGFAAWTAVPTTLPQISLVAVGDDGTVIDFGWTAVDDTSATTVDWEAPHDLLLDFSADPVDADTAGNLTGPVRLFLLIRGAADAAFEDVLFANPVVYVKAKPWA